MSLVLLHPQTEEANRAFLSWTVSKIPHVDNERGFGPARAVGVATGHGPEDKLYAVVVFHDYQPECRTVQMSVAAKNPRWATRGLFKRIYDIPFLEFGVNKVWSAIPHTSERVVKFCKITGMKQEATLVDHFGPGVHAVICRMTRREFERRYLRGSASSGQEFSESPAGS